MFHINSDNIIAVYQISNSKWAPEHSNRQRRQRIRVEELAGARSLVTRDCGAGVPSSPTADVGATHADEMR